MLRFVLISPNLTFVLPHKTIVFDHFLFYNFHRSPTIHLCSLTPPAILVLFSNPTIHNIYHVKGKIGMMMLNKNTRFYNTVSTFENKIMMRSTILFIHYTMNTSQPSEVKNPIFNNTIIY